MIEKSKGRIYLDGLKDGIAICIAYFVVSFTFGITVVNYGMPWWYATLISATNITSAGQFAGVNLIVANAAYYEILITVLFINLRYFLMSVSLSQQLDPKTSTLKRIIMSIFVTDEIFALASTKGNKLKFIYFLGLSTFPYLGWTLGTLTGGLVNGLMPESLQAAMGIALYGMFIAIILPPAKKKKEIILAISLSIGISCLFYYTPYLKEVSFGFRVIIATLLGAGITAVVFPVKDAVEENENVLKYADEEYKRVANNEELASNTLESQCFDDNIVEEEDK